jgi:large repetitive protein
MKKLPGISMTTSGLRSLLTSSFAFLCLLINPVTTSAQETSIDQGLTWLLSVQEPDGSWSSEDRKYVDTYTGLEALLVLGSQDPQTSLTLTWLRNQTFDNTDDLAHKVFLLSLAGESVSSELVTLLTYQTFNGGWGSAPNFSSDILDSALVLLALASDGNSNPVLLNQVADFLVNYQNSDGSWGLTSDANTSLFVTATVMQALSTQPQTTAIANALAQSTTFLLAHQNPDGGFGESPSTVWETALSFLAIAKTTGDVTARTAAIDYLLATQQVDGSWEQDPYQTALALQALHASLDQTAQLPPPPTTGTLTGNMADGTTQVPLEGVLVEVLSTAVSSMTKSRASRTGMGTS